MYEHQCLVMLQYYTLPYKQFTHQLIIDKWAQLQNCSYHYISIVYRPTMYDNNVARVLQLL